MALSFNGLGDQKFQRLMELVDSHRALPKYPPLLGSTPAMQAVQEIINQVADTSTTLLIRGESGVGKELVARAIHAASPRRAHPFVKVNCAALPAELLESELFGHPSSWTRSASFPSPSRPIPRSSPPPTGTWKLPWPPANSARISTTVSMSSRSGCPRCASGGRRSRPSSTSFWRNSSVNTDERWSSRPKPFAASAQPEPSVGRRELSRRAARAAERKVIEEVLEQVRWNRSEAARVLKINYKTLLTKITQCGLAPKKRRQKGSP